MRIFLLNISLIILMASCHKKESFSPQMSSTIQIDKDDTNDSIIFKAAHIAPTQNQYDALKNEFIAFIHFGPNTFTKKEWGNGYEDPKVFNLQNLDTDQWCNAMKSAGMKMVILTVKHHDGFVLWQSRYTKHGIMSTPFKNGKGDVLKELSESCQKYGLKLGVYLSPADLFQIENKEGLYGNLSQYSDRIIPRPVEGKPFKNKTTFTFNVDDYNEYFLNQLFELLTEYGPIHEVWFDGAHPKRKGGQKYNYLAWKELISTLAPKAVIFGKQDIRWCGNESGGTRETEWNVIPYPTNPNEMNRFPDITAEDIGSREKLLKAKYLHYQQAEINTSIREGWFYRDDTNQKVRSADDVFDIYERSAGGNSTFLLNIPPNRDGKFSEQDVKVLKEVGNRINKTYSKNLFEKAKGPANVLDENDTNFELLSKDSKDIIIETKQQVTINRVVIKESINTHGERVEKHALDAWVDGKWKEITSATNIGYKRILRFPEVTSNKFRIRMLESRLNPAISTIAAYHYKTRPPQLSITRDNKGLLSIKPKEQSFRWKWHGQNPTTNLNSNFEIRYTLDGSTPTKSSKLFTKSIPVSSVTVKAAAINKEQIGSVASTKFGIEKKGWNDLNTDNIISDHKPSNAFDSDPYTFWKSHPSSREHYIAIDFGKAKTLKSLRYTPYKAKALKSLIHASKDSKSGMIEKGLIEISNDGKTWTRVESFEFGNLINDPTPRTHQFNKPITTRYIKIAAKAITNNRKTAAIAEIDFFE